jgi:hypothetical protein
MNANKITAANAGGTSQFPIRTHWAARISMIILTALTIGFVGCKSAQNRDCGSNFWNYVPSPSIDKPKGSPAEVALPTLPYTTNRIELFVRGEVVAPGAIKPPQGCTVLQAVSYAGGFTAFAFTRRLKLMKASGGSFNLHLRSRAKGLCGHRQVWYELENPSATDYILEAGDKLHVPRTGS